MRANSPYWAGTRHREQKRLRVSCTEYGMMVAQSYLKQHMESLHGLCAPQMRGVDEKGEGPTTYMVSFPQIIQSRIFLVPG